MLLGGLLSWFASVLQHFCSLRFELRARLPSWIGFCICDAVANFTQKLQILDGAARGAQVQTGLPPGTWPLMATTLAILLVLRVAAARERWAGTPWVPDAHDLHD